MGKRKVHRDKETSIGTFSTRSHFVHPLQPFLPSCQPCPVPVPVFHSLITADARVERSK